MPKKRTCLADSERTFKFEVCAYADHSASMRVVLVDADGMPVPHTLGRAKKCDLTTKNFMAGRLVPFGYKGRHLVRISLFVTFSEPIPKPLLLRIRVRNLGLRGHKVYFPAVARLEEVGTDVLWTGQDSSTND